MSIHLTSDGWLLLAIIACVVVEFYVLMPLRFKRKTLSTLVDHCPIELQGLPADIANKFIAASQRLTSCGFHELGLYTARCIDIGQESYVSFWTNTSLTDVAVILGMRMQLRMTAFRVITSVAFETKFTNGTSIVTTNVDSPDVLPRDPQVKEICCPLVHDLALLYRCHSALVIRDRGARTIALSGAEDPPVKLRSEYLDTFRRAIDAGYYWLDEPHQCLKRTYKGAFLMTYCLLPPARQIQRMMSFRHADKTLRKLGFGGLRAFRLAQQGPDEKKPIGS